MPCINFTYHLQFFTATIFEWKHLLADDKYKNIIIESLLFLKSEKSVVIYYGFVIMPNHIHIIFFPQCLSKDLCVSKGHCGIVGKDFADINYGNRTAISQANTQGYLGHIAIKKKSLPLISICKKRTLIITFLISRKT